MAVGPGTILDARYRVDEELGIGGMGTVWRGHDPRFNRKVAIKVLRSDDPDPQLISRFRREAEILGNLSDQGITVAYDCGQHNGHFFIVMELLEGSDLAKVLESHSGGLPVARALTLAVQAAKALAAAHGRGVVHRDIKPSNLFIVRDDQLKICDFGIAKWVDSDWTRTQPGLVMGTPAYMSPEQSGSADAADELSDLYSLGCVMYEMLTGFPPFGRNHDWSRVGRSQWGRPPQPLSGIEPVPQTLSDLVLSLLARDRDERPRSASVVAETLTEIQKGGMRGERRQQQRRRQESPRGDPGADSPPHDAPPRDVPPRDAPPGDAPQRITTEELRAMGPERAAAFLRGISSPAFAATALSGLEPREAARLLTRLGHAKAAAFLVAFANPEPVARVLAMMDPADQVAIIARIENADRLGPILDAMRRGRPRGCPARWRHRSWRTR